ncbi:hypothetical protein [Aquiflexum lacus]|uniref:hypothetical protein n=1 Tax=Aquiflexum lacus TaxID=2483805 RepID=UPI001895AA9E|nr:hypothetical protein [Aquiflexum lacus]
MDSFVIFWGLSILLFISIIVGLIYLAYWLPKRLGKRKLGLWLSGILTVGLLTLIVATVFEDQFFFKSDAIEKLKEHNVELIDDFKILSNESGGFMDYFHQFRLTISPADKERLIDQIKSADNYEDEVQDMFDLRSGKIRYSDKDTSFTANYQDGSNYIYEYYKPNKQGYTPTWDRISISKTENKLNYERILD